MAAIFPVLLLLMLWWVVGIKGVITILLFLACLFLPERAAMAAAGVAIVVLLTTGC